MLLPYLLVYALVNPASTAQSNINENMVIAQSRILYECTQNGVSPAISDSQFQDGFYCLIPVSAGKCLGYADGFGYSRINNTDPRGMVDCDSVTIVEDRLDGKKYYRFVQKDQFILEN